MSSGSSLSFARGVMKAYEDTFKPPASAAKAAARGLEMREKQPPSKRGGTAVGVSRARDLKARKALSKDTIKRMVSFFARHRDPESSSSKTRGDGPSEAKQADLLWGGSAGKRWANSVKRKLEAKGEYSDEEQATPAPPEDRIEGSDKNPKGSARKAGGIDLDARTERALRGKARNHNIRMREPWQKTTKGALEAVWRRGAGAYSTSHRPNVSRAAWAMARVNAFLHLLRTGKPKDPKYKSDNDLLPRDHPKKSGRDEKGRYVMASSSFYADDEDGRWVTIGAQAVEGPNGKTKKEGGTPVFIKRSGEITKGPKGLVGRNVSNLKEPSKGEKGDGESKGKSEKPKIEFDDSETKLNGVQLGDVGLDVIDRIVDSGADPDDISPQSPTKPVKVEGGTDTLRGAQFSTIKGSVRMIRPPSEAYPTGLIAFEGKIARLGREAEEIDIKFEGGLDDLDDVLGKRYDDAKNHPKIKDQVQSAEKKREAAVDREQAERRSKDERIRDRAKKTSVPQNPKSEDEPKKDDRRKQDRDADNMKAQIESAIQSAESKGKRPKPPKTLDISIHVGDGVYEKKPVKPKAVARSGEMFTHKSLGGRGWTLTHKRSGKIISDFDTLKSANRAMDVLDESMSWDFDDISEGIRSGRNDPQKVGPILKAVKAGYADTPIHYADESKGRWITIGARSKKGGDSDGPSGGARVFIKDGKVAKGPGAVKGKSLSQIDKGKPKTGMAPAAKAKIGATKEPKGRKSKVDFAKTIRDFDAMSRKDRYGKIGQLDDELSKMKKGGASQEEIATAKDRLEQLKAKNRELMESEEKDLMVDQRGIVSSGPSWLIGGRIEAPGDDATAKVREARKEGVLDAGGGYQISNDTGTIVKVPKGMKALRGAKLVGREGRKIHERVQDNAQRVESAKDKRRDADQAKRREAMAARKKKIEGIRKSIGLDKREPKGEEVKKGRLVDVKKGRLLSEAERFGRAMRGRKAKRRKARAGGGKWVAERQAKRGKRGILSRLGFADEAVSYADEEDGRWVTIGAKEVDGKKKGGTPVFISQGGKITKGPKALTGRNVSNLKEPPKEDASEDDGAEDSKKTSATNDVSKMAEMLENTGLADSHGLIMRSWEKGDKKRIYIKRQLSKRVQDVGFIDIDKRDNVTYESQRINSVIRKLASWAREIIDGEFSDDLTHYAESGGRWITIGAVEEEDQATGKTSRKGGTPVFIRNGKITKGPKSLTGKSIGKLDKDIPPKKAKASRQKAFEETFKRIKAESEAKAKAPKTEAPKPKTEAPESEAPESEMKVKPGGKTVKGKYGPAIIKDVGGFDVKVEVNNPDGTRRPKEERDAEALERGIAKKKRFEAKMRREMGTRAPKKTATPDPEKPKAEAPKKKLTGAELDKFIRERSDVGKKHSERRFRRALPSDAEKSKTKPKKAKKERRPFEDAEDMRAVNKRLDMIAQGVRRKRAREAARRAGRKTFAADVLRMYQEAFA